MNICGSLSSRRRNATRRLFTAGFATVVSIAANYTFATEPSDAHRFEINGTGTLALDAPVQHNGTLSLKALLSPTSVATTVAVLQTGNRFALTATLAAAPTACYSDTIFRDDFDGDGF